MPVIVHLHTSFVYGRLDNDSFKDMPHLNSNELGSLIDFITKCLNGDPLPGRNKRSWINGSGMVIPGCDGYRAANVWHYHAGPHIDTGRHGTKNIRHENLGPMTSPAVIHYTWRGMMHKELVVLGFSPCHKPFPAYSDKKNAVRNRSRIGGLYSEDVLIDASEFCGA